MSEPLSSTLKDQQEVAITIYNSNIGLVKDTRVIPLRTGLLELKFTDVAAKIDAARRAERVRRGLHIEQI